MRDKAVAALSRFLAGHSKKLGPDGEALEEILAVGELDWDQEWIVDARLAAPEMAKLWKGIFFCSSRRHLRPKSAIIDFFLVAGFWMSDKPLVQQALADNLSNLALEVRASKKNSSGQGRVARFRSAMEYLKGFWDAIVREWGGLDRLRLDKFYLLIRRFVGVGFKLLAREEWDLTAIAEYNHCLTGPGGPLQSVVLSPGVQSDELTLCDDSVLDSRIPHSLAYHLADIYIDELERSLPAIPASALRVVPLVPLLQPFLTTFALCPSSTMFARISDNLFSPLFDYSVPLPPQPKSKRRKIESQLAIAEYPRIFEQAQVEEMSGNEGVEEGRRLCGEGVLKALFEEGGKKETNEVNRRRMYKLWREKSGEGDAVDA